MSSRYLSAGLATLLLASFALANAAPIPRPVVNKSTDAKLVVQVDPAAKKPILKVPAALVAQGPGGVQPGGPPPRPGQVLLENPMLLLSGLALTGAFVSGGFWILRGRAGKSVVMVLGLLAVGLASGSLFADLAIPPRPAPLKAINLPAQVGLSGDVTLQVYTDPFDRNLYLIVPGEKAAEKTPPPGAKPE